MTEHGCRAGIRPEQRGQDTDRGGFAGAIRTQQPVNGSLPDAKIYAVQRAGCAKSFDQAAGFDCV
jgi:hypothetical protein